MLCFFIHHKVRIIPLYHNCARQIYMQKGVMKDCQNMHQSNVLCYSNHSQSVEDRRQKEREYKLGNNLLYLLQILLQTFVQNSVLLPESHYVESQ